MSVWGVGLGFCKLLNASCMLYGTRHDGVISVRGVRLGLAASPLAAKVGLVLTWPSNAQRASTGPNLHS